MPIDKPVPFSPSLPDVTKAQAVRAYRLGNYIAFVAHSPPSLLESHGLALGIVEYAYVLYVTPSNPPHLPILFVTAERSGSKLREASAKSGSPTEEETFLCIFDSSGEHQNLGVVPNLENLDVFSAHALAIVRDRFGIQESPEEFQKGGRAASTSGKAGCLSIIVLGMVPIAILLIS